MKIAVTGASGYIGRALCEKLAIEHEVFYGSRKIPEWLKDHHKWFYYELSQKPASPLLENVDVIIHLAAYTHRPDDASHIIEIGAAKHLKQLCDKHATHFIYFSSIASSACAPTQYGKTKYVIEQEIHGSLSAIIRPGLVFGGYEMGLYGKLCYSLRILPIIPRFQPKLFVQPIHIDDLILGIKRIINQKLTGTYHIAASERVPFSDFLILISKYHLRKRKITIWTPWKLLLVALRVVNKLLPLKINPEQLISLSKVPYADSSKDLEALGITLLSIELALAGEVRLRLEEAHCMYKYVGIYHPDKSQLRNYVKYTKQFSQIILPNMFQKLISSFNSLYDVPNTVFRQRAKVAFYLMETSPSHNQRIYHTPFLLKSGQLVITTLSLIVLTGFNKIAHPKEYVVTGSNHDTHTM